MIFIINSNTHKGIIKVEADGSSHFLELDDSNEFSTIVDILRNEKPLRFKPPFLIMTQDEEVGEGET